MLTATLGVRWSGRRVARDLVTCLSRRSLCVRGSLLTCHSLHNAFAHCGNSVPACSATMYLAYQSGQFASLSPVRFSCSP